MERTAGGLTVATIDGKLEAQQELDLQKVLENIQTSTQITVPKKVEIEHHMPSDTNAFKESIMSRNMSISRALLLPSLVGFGEETSTGSQARSQTQMQAWLMYLDALSRWVADKLNEQLFRELTVWNFGEDVDPPLFEYESLTQEQKQAFAEQWVAAVAGKAVKNTVEDEDRLRDMLHFGERDPDAELVFEPDESTPSGIAQPPPSVGVPVPDGVNPLDSATAGLQSRLATIPAGQEFINRTNHTAISEEIYQEEGDEFGRNVEEAVDFIWRDIVSDVRTGDPWTLENVNTLAAPDTTQMEGVLRHHLNRTFQQGQTSAWGEIDILRMEQGLDSVAKPEGLAGMIRMSFMARLEMEWAGFALDQETAERYLEVKLLEMTGHIANDQILATARTAIINGLRTDQSIDEIVADAQAALEPIIGKRTEAGALITEAGLAARLATLVRTSLTEAFNEGRRTFFEDPSLEGYVEAYQYSAVIDDRTTEFCKRANGRIWPVRSNLWQRFVPPNHFNCRSLLVPVVQGDQWGESRDMPDSVQPAPGFGAG